MVLHKEIKVFPHQLILVNEATCISRGIVTTRISMLSVLECPAVNLVLILTGLIKQVSNLFKKQSFVVVVLFVVFFFLFPLISFGGTNLNTLCIRVSQTTNQTLIWEMLIANSNLGRTPKPRTYLLKNVCLFSHV